MRALWSAVLLVAAFACDSSTDVSTVSSSATGSSGSGSGGSSTVTYHEHVAPILAARCNGCHGDEGIAPFALERYADVAPLAGAIATATAARTMPPWPADNSGACNTWRDARWLTDAELETIARWVEGGALEGDPALHPDEPPWPPGLAVVSATLDPSEPYTPNASLSDDYRCFLVDAGLVSPKFLTDFEVKPGAPSVVHHVILYAPETDGDAVAAEKFDAAEPGPGYTCFGGAGVAARFVAGWAPGSPVTHYPKDTGLELAPNRKLVMQVHYNLAQGPAPDRTTIDLTLVDQVKFPARVDLLSDGSLKLPPNQSDVTAGTSFTTPVGGRVYGVFPHMHQLGTKLRVERKSQGKASCMVDVPDWDFHWQQFYFYEQPIEIAAGDELSIACHYDTMGQTKTVTFGEGTDDEMCLNFFYSTLGTKHCSSCGAAVTGKGDPTNVCASSSAVFGALASCVCQEKCSKECTSNVCAGGTPSADCQECLTAGCGPELAACLADP